MLWYPWILKITVILGSISDRSWSMQEYIRRSISVIDPKNSKLSSLPSDGCKMTTCSVAGSKLMELIVSPLVFFDICSCPFPRHGLTRNDSISWMQAGRQRTFPFDRYWIWRENHVAKESIPPWRSEHLFVENTARNCNVQGSTPWTTIWAMRGDGRHLENLGKWIPCNIAAILQADIL